MTVTFGMVLTLVVVLALIVVAIWCVYDQQTDHVRQLDNLTTSYLMMEADVTELKRQLRELKVDH